MTTSSGPSPEDCPPDAPSPKPRFDLPSIPGSTIPRKIAWLAGPVFVEQSLLYLIGLSDTVLTGRHLSSDDLAGVTVAGYLLWFLASVLTIASIGGTALVARSVGAGRWEAANRACGQAFLLGLGLGLALAVGVDRFAGGLVERMNLAGTAAWSAERYLQLVGIVLPLLACTAVGNACLRGAGDTRTGMKVMALMNLINITASWTLALGLGPFPRLGLTGVALGTAVGEGVGGMLILTALIRGRSGLRLTWPHLRPDREVLRRLLRVSLPATGESLTNVVCQLWFLGLINRLGAVATAAHGVAIRCEAIAFLTISAFAVAASTLTGQCLGAHRPELAIRSARAAWLLGTAVLSILGILLYAGAEVMFRFFLAGRQPEVLEAGVPVLRLVCLALPALATINVLNGTLNGAGDTRWPWLITMTGYLAVRLPLTEWFIALPHDGGWGLGLWGAWLAMFADLYLRAVLVAGRFLSGRWVRVRV